MVLSTVHVRLGPVRDIITHMSQNRAFRRLAVTHGFQAVPAVPRETNVHPLSPDLLLLRLLLLVLRLG